MTTQRNGPNGGASFQDVMSAWILFAVLAGALAVGTLAFDKTGSTSQPARDDLAAAAPARLARQVAPTPDPDSQRFLTQHSVRGQAEP